MLGNRKLLSGKGIKTDDIEKLLRKLEGEGKTTMILAVDGIVKEIIGVADTLKEYSL